MEFDVLHSKLQILYGEQKPFAAYSYPGEKDFYLILSGNNNTSKSVNLNDFCGFAVSRYGQNAILQELSDISDTDNHDICNTERSTYLQGIKKAISTLKSSESKVVISRVKNILSLADPFDVAGSYFPAHNHCFRAIFYTPAIGLWIVATPELLFEYSRHDGTIQTMALAGTRPNRQIGKWDNKNTAEHNLVVKYIVDTLKHFKLDVDVSEAENIVFGSIAHLCHKIKARGNPDLNLLFEALNPTPAVCGFPVEKARKLISEIEIHPRLYYSGTIAVGEKDIIKLFVNLRCAKVTQNDSGYNYTLFAGGGINIMSNPDSEWEETDLKMRSLTNSIELSKKK